MKTKLTFITAVFLLISFFSSSAIEIPDKKIVLKNDTNQQIFDIRINKDNLVILRATTNKKNKRINFVVKVYSEKGSVLYTRSYFRKGDVLIPFDISKFSAGMYTFSVFKGLEKVYTKDIKKRPVKSIETDNIKVIVKNK